MLKNSECEDEEVKQSRPDGNVTKFHLFMFTVNDNYNVYGCVWRCYTIFVRMQITMGMDLGQASKNHAHPLLWHT